MSRLTWPVFAQLQRPNLRLCSMGFLTRAIRLDFRMGHYKWLFPYVCAGLSLSKEFAFAALCSIGNETML